MEWGEIEEKLIAASDTLKLTHTSFWVVERLNLEIETLRECLLAILSELSERERRET